MDLQQLLDEGIIDEVYQQLKTGKEAEVWLVSHRGEPVAAKLYKAREFRSFKNDAGYLEGRQVRNTRTQRAMDRGTAFGRQASEEAWKSAEADALFALHAAGVRVPKPVLFYEGVLLMEVIGDHEGRVAPRLVDAGLTREHALPLYEQLRGEVVKMLAADYIHGDLSEFNILLGVNGPVIIDFPQTVAAARNSRSEPFFRRDLGNLLRFFSGLDPAVERHRGDVDDIWRAYVRRELTADYVPTDRSARDRPAPPPPGGGGPGRGPTRGPTRPGGGGPERRAGRPPVETGPARGGAPGQGQRPGGGRRGPEVSYRGPEPRPQGGPGAPRGPQASASHRDGSLLPDRAARADANAPGAPRRGGPEGGAAPMGAGPAQHAHSGTAPRADGSRQAQDRRDRGTPSTSPPGQRPHHRRRRHR
ncbi:MAG: hypothetical protein INH41_22600 [Myxococcaceae bacterium]|nr:hypothetical protein [Myxococcaceae bacterium]MCA3015188.1 hypothetical protein [Myxococcaceae bacterium]